MNESTEQMLIDARAENTAFEIAELFNAFRAKQSNQVLPCDAAGDAQDGDQ